MYARHYTLLLNTNHEQGQNFLKNSLKTKKYVYFKNGVKTVQTAGYNGAHMVVFLG
jgi:hypothetical protein